MTTHLPRKVKTGQVKVQEQRARLLQVQAEVKEMEAARLRGELVPTPLVRVVIERMFTAFNARLNVIPRKSVARLRGVVQDAEKEVVIRELVREAQDEFNNFDFAGIIRGAGESLSAGGDGAEAAADLDGEPVGGPVSDTVS